MTAHVSNVAMIGSAARMARAFGSGSARQQVDSVEGASGPPARGFAGQSESYDRYAQSGAIPRYGFVQDHVVSFGGVLVSHEVGATIMQAQALNGSFPLPPVEAERHIANYEFAQSLMGPPEAMADVAPFVQRMQ